MGKTAFAREWKLVLFPIAQNFYDKIVRQPDSQNLQLPKSSILARWQIPIQVLAVTRDPEKLKKNKRKLSPIEDWPKKKPKFGGKLRKFFEKVLAETDNELLERLDNDAENIVCKIKEEIFGHY